jgi:hypothetical protein
LLVGVLGFGRIILTPLGLPPRRQPTLPLRRAKWPSIRLSLSIR